MELHSQLVRTGPLLAILSGAPFVASLDLFVVNVAFGDIAKSYPGHSLGEFSWILNSYAIVYAALLIPLGRWADRIGHKRAFIAGLALFTLASAACAFSPSLWALVAFRIVQAVGAAALTPASLGLLINALPAAKRQSGVRIWAAAGAAAAAFGPVVGGILVEASWRWVFLINVPVGIVLLYFAVRLVPDTTHKDPDAGIDFVGAALLTVGIGSLAWHSSRSGLGMDRQSRSDRLRRGRRDTTLVLVEQLSSPDSVDCSGSSEDPLVCLVQRHRHPVQRSIRRGSSLEHPVAPGSLGILGSANRFRRLTGSASRSAVRHRRRIADAQVLGGTRRRTRQLLWAVGTVLVLVSVDTKPNYATGLLPGWIIAGIGVGLALPTILSQATADLAPARSATGSAIVSMSRQIGTVLGVSVLIAVLGSAVDYDTFRQAWWVIFGVALVSALASLGMTPATTPTPVVPAESAIPERNLS